MTQASIPTTDLVAIVSGQPMTTTIAIAEGTGNDHASVIKLARAYFGDLERFGHVDFKSEMVERPQGGGTDREYALLNERQATLLISYMRNNDVVRSFKIRLVDAFFRLAEATRAKTPGEALVEMAQGFLAHERQIAALQHQQAETAAQVRALVDGEDYWTIVGYGNLIGEQLDVRRSRHLGRIASRICREQGWAIGQASHPLYGAIHSYPRPAVALAFDQGDAA